MRTLIPRLFLFLAVKLGSTTPKFARKFKDTSRASSMGFHVDSLRVPDTFAGFTVCGAAVDKALHYRSVVHRVWRCGVCGYVCTRGTLVCVVMCVGIHVRA